MTVAGRKHGRFSLERLLAPRSVAVLGCETAEGQVVLANLRAGGFTGPITGLACRGLPAAIAALGEAPDLAVLAGDPAEAGAVLQALAARGTYAAVALRQVAGLDGLAHAAGVRVLGPSSFGLAVPHLKLNASLSHIPVPAGRVALLTQSASLARAVLDWAAPNGVGFCHIVGVGGSADLGFSLALDWLSRSAETGLILMDIRRVRDRRAFISAARAASRLRPVVAIRPGARLVDPSGEAEAVMAAALNRAGVFMVRHFEEFLAAAETLSRSRPARGEQLAIVTNAIGPGRLAADAAVEAGIELAILPADAQSALSASLPAELVYGLVYAGSAAPMHVAEIAAMLTAVPAVGGVLVLLAPTGVADSAAVQAVLAAASATKIPIVACVMGETTGAAHRRVLAAAGLPVFATPEQAVRAFGHLLRDRRARIAARELPGRRVLEVAPDHAVVSRLLAGEAGAAALAPAAVGALLGAYGVTLSSAAPGAVQARLRVRDDAVFGPALALRAGGVEAWEMPPLNLPLARGFATRAGVPEACLTACTRLLVRISQLVVDEPGWLRPEGAVVGHAAIGLRPPGTRAQLAISPYPEHLIEAWSAKGQDFIVRPIRPEDAEAHAAMIRRVPAEDLRFRFFTAMREISPEQMARLTQIDYEREMAFIAVRVADQATVGVARLVREVGEPRGEFAIVVEPSVKGLGLARHLMDRLTGWAREVGVSKISGSVLADNHAMLGFVRRLGFTVQRVEGEPELVEATLMV